MVTKPDISADPIDIEISMLESTLCDKAETKAFASIVALKKKSVECLEKCKEIIPTATVRNKHNLWLGAFGQQWLLDYHTRIQS